MRVSIIKFIYPDTYLYYRRSYNWDFLDYLYSILKDLWDYCVKLATSVPC